ncbi:class I SAM-dependent methyltransferase [Mycobacterium seoulense]|uniref:class I SAM-dependent methyltransferase n=1 Tax=Mycobacterium seoulense TaxID=386911 RepID=UPI003CEEBD30
MALTLNQARSVYDRIGHLQDWQAFYEDAATDRLVAEAALAGDQTVFEFGCGTGRFAARLLGSLPGAVNYLGVDISPVMIDLATRRLAAWAERAKVVLVEGTLPLPADDGFADRVISTFVFDLLDVQYAREVLHDLRRILAPDGLLCLSSLAHGDRSLERAVSQVWTGLWRVAPQLVGGCRPISLSALLGDDWQVQHHSRVRRFGLVTDVVIAAPNSPQP